MPINNQDIQDFNDLKDLYFSKQDWDSNVYQSFYKDFTKFLININFDNSALDSGYTSKYNSEQIAATLGFTKITDLIKDQIRKVEDKKSFEAIFSFYHEQNINYAGFIFERISKLNQSDFNVLCYSLGLQNYVNIDFKIQYIFEARQSGIKRLFCLFKTEIWFWVELEVKKFINGKQKVERFLQEYKHITENFREIDLNQSIENYIKVKNQNRVEENVLTRDIGNFLSNQGFRDLGLIFEGKTTPVAKGHGRCDIISQSYDFIIESKYYKGSDLIIESQDAVNQGVKYCKDHFIKNLYVIIFLSDEGKFESAVEKSGNVEGINYTIHCVDIRLDKTPPSKSTKKKAKNQTVC
jgi:hypothetical protein